MQEFVADLISMQAAHSTFDLSCTQIADSITLRRFDEHATEQTNHTSCVEQMVRLAGWHGILNASDKVITPRSVLAAHMLLL